MDEMDVDSLNINNRHVGIDCESGLGTDYDDTSSLDGDIKVEYHPNSGHECKTFTFEEFQHTLTEARNTHPADPEPWLPFKTRQDFEFAEIALGTGMSRDQINALIRLFRKCLEIGKESFTFLNYDDMHNTQTLASERLPKVGFKFRCMFLTFPDCIVQV